MLIICATVAEWYKLTHRALTCCKTPINQSIILLSRFTFPGSPAQKRPICVDVLLGSEYGSH